MVLAKRNKGIIVSEYAERWPRAVFDLREKANRIMPELKDLLKRPGVYVLYVDDRPYYIGKTDKSVYNRLHRHANNVGERYYRYWNYFSVFFVDSTKHLGDVEGILIAAIPRAANSATPNFDKMKLPRKFTNLLSRIHRISIDELKV